MRRDITVGDGNAARRIAVETRDGAGPPVVWFGGFRSDMAGTKADALDAWAAKAGRAFVRFDYSGHGVSGGRFEDGTISRWLEEGLAVLAQFAKDRPVIVGSSMGGWIALLACRALRTQGGAIVHDDRAGDTLSPLGSFAQNVGSDPSPSGEGESAPADRGGVQPRPGVPHPGSKLRFDSALPFREGSSPVRAVEGAASALVLIAPAADFTERLMWDAFPPEAKAAIEETGVYVRPSLYAEDGYPITRGLIEDGRRHLLLDGTIETGCPVHILQGMQDPDVPWEHAMRLVEHLPADAVQITLVKDGDHRLSRPEDIERLIAAVAAAGEPPRLSDPGSPQLRLTV